MNRIVEQRRVQERKKNEEKETGGASVRPSDYTSIKQLALDCSISQLLPRFLANFNKQSRSLSLSPPAPFLFAALPLS